MCSNDIVFYIGKGSKTDKYDRITHHVKFWKFNKNRKLLNKIKKLEGIFDIKIIYESEDEKECLDIEMQLIEEIGIKNLCNLTNGGEGVSGLKHSEESKKKISLFRKGKKLSKETCRLISKNKKGMYYSLNNEIKKQIINLYKTKSVNTISLELGLTFSTVKRYLNEQGLYKKCKNTKSTSEEGKKNMSLARKDINNKPIIQYDLDGNIIGEFKSMSEVCKNINDIKNISGISSCCNGKQKTAHGFKWKYKN